MIYCFGDYYTLLGYHCTSNVLCSLRRHCKRPEIVSATWQDEEVRGDNLEGAQVLVGHTEHLVCLICLDKLVCELLHELGADGPRERNHEVVVQV